MIYAESPGSTNVRSYLAALLAGSLVLECAALAQVVWADEDTSPTPVTQSVAPPARHTPAAEQKEPRVTRTPKVQATAPSSSAGTPQTAPTAGSQSPRPQPSTATPVKPFSTVTRLVISGVLSVMPCPAAL